MADNESKFTVTFDGTKGSLQKTVNDLKNELRNEAREIERTFSSINLFKNLVDQNKPVIDAVKQTRREFELLKEAVTAIEKAGGTVTKDLTKQLKEAEKAANDAMKEYRAHRDMLLEVRKAMTAVGVDAKNLAAEELRLATAMRDVHKAAQEAGAKGLLGIQTMRDIQPQIQALNTAFKQLAASGKLSMGEIQLAAVQLQRQIQALEETTGRTTVTWQQFRQAMLGMVLVLGTVSAALIKTDSDFRAFTKSMAAIETIAGVSKTKMAELSDGVRALSRTMGVDAVESAKALYDIIGSGIPADNALAVLQLSTKAAIAGLTDVTTAAKIGVQTINAYGLEINQLERVYDVLFKTVRDGISTFPELAVQLGDVIPSARSAKVSLEEVGAAMVVLTRAGIPTAEAATALNRVIQDLAAPAPEATKALREIGVEFDGLSKTIETLSKKSLTLGQLRDLVPDQRAVKGIQVLTQSFKLFRDEIDEISKQEPALEQAYAIMAATPQAQVDRFKSSMKDLSIAVGEFVHGTGAMLEAMTGMINAFNTMTPATKSMVFEVVGATAAFGALYFALTRLAIPINLLAASLLGLVPALSGVASGLTAASLAMGIFKTALAGFLGFEFGKELFKNSETVRVFGDLLGVAAGRVDNLATYALARLSAAFSGNTKAADEARAVFKANLAVLDEMGRSIASGVTEKLRQLQIQFEALQKKLAEVGTAAVKSATDLQTGIGLIAAAVKTQLDAVDAAIVNLNTHLTNLVQKLAENVTASQAQTAAAVSNITAVAQARIDALSKAEKDEIATQRASNSILLQLANDRMEAITKGAKETLAAFEAEAKARIDIATRTAGNVKNVEQDILVTKRGVLQKIVDEYRAHVKALTDQDQARLQKVQELENQRRGITEDIGDKIRALQREQLSIEQQYADKRLQVEENLDKARDALLAGNLKQAEEYAKKAITLTDGIAKEVKEGETVIVGAADAAKIATNLYEDAQRILTLTISKRIEVEKKGHQDNAAGLDAAKAKLADYTKQLQEVTALAEKGLVMRVEANTEAVERTLKELAAKVEQQQAIMKVNLDIQAAKLETDRVRAELEKGITINVEARTEKIKQSLIDVQTAAKPLNIEVNAQTEAALLKIEEVKTAAVSLRIVQLEIKSNAEEVQKAINSLKEPTESTHTIHVKRVDEGGGTVTTTTESTGGASGSFHAGGPVQHFAGGGPAFPRPTWSKVPGSGSGDIVRAALMSGSFVVRKAAARYYGDGLMGTVARGYASGGSVMKELPALTKAELAVGYFNAIRPYLIPYAIFRYPVSFMAQRVKLLERDPSDTATAEALVKDAASIAANFALYTTSLGKISPGGGPVGKPLISFEEYLKNVRTGGATFAEGGSAIGNDTVPAMLEPQEWVMQRPAVQKYGNAFMHAINQMLIPRDLLRSMVSPPQVRHFSTGGPVPYSGFVNVLGARIPEDVRLSSQTSGNTFNLTFNGVDISDDRELRRIASRLDDLTRRTGK